MRADDIRRLLRRPFRPFRFYVLETTSYEVHHPDYLLVSQSTMTLYWPRTLGGPSVFERSVTIALLHVSKYEFLPPNN